MNGGTDKVTIVYSLLNAVKMSHMAYNKAMEDEREERKNRKKLKRRKLMRNGKEICLRRKKNNGMLKLEIWN